MKTEAIQIVDHGRGPQLSTTRITVLDIFYYLHRGHDFNFIQQAMPSLSREEFDVVLEYVNAHYQELVQKDRKAAEFIRKGIEAQRTRGGIFAESNENLTTEQRVARLKELMMKKLAEKNGTSPQAEAAPPEPAAPPAKNPHLGLLALLKRQAEENKIDWRTYRRLPTE